MDKWYEWKCKHGIGHPRRDYLDKYDPDGSALLSVHVCCGCCIDGDPSDLAPLKRPPIDDDFPYMILEQVLQMIDDE